MRVSLAASIQSFRLNVWQKPPACRKRLGPGTDSVPSADRLYGPEGIRISPPTTGGTSERDNKWNYDSPRPFHNQLKIISAIRNEIASPP